jgi:hypothetical protein
MKNVSEQWTVPWALSPYMQVKSLPVITNSRPNAFENACPSFLQPQTQGQIHNFSLVKAR